MSQFLIFMAKVTFIAVVCPILVIGLFTPDDVMAKKRSKPGLVFWTLYWSAFVAGWVCVIWVAVHDG